MRERERVSERAERKIQRKKRRKQQRKKAFISLYLATQKATTNLVHFVINITRLKIAFKFRKISNYNHVDGIKLDEELWGFR